MNKTTLTVLILFYSIGMLFSCTKDGNSGDSDPQHNILDGYQLTTLNWWYSGDSITRGEPSDIDSVYYDEKDRISSVIAQRYFGPRDSTLFSFDHNAANKTSHLRKTWLPASKNTYYDYNFDYDANGKLKMLTVDQSPAAAYYPLKEYFEYDSKGNMKTAKRFDQRGLLIDSAVYYRNTEGSAMDSISIHSFVYDEYWNIRSEAKAAYIFDNTGSASKNLLDVMNIINSSAYILTIPARNANWDLFSGEASPDAMYIFQFYNPDIFILKSCKYIVYRTDEPTFNGQINWYASYYDNGLLKALKYDLDKVEGNSSSIELKYNKK